MTTLPLIETVNWTKKTKIMKTADVWPKANKAVQLSTVEKGNRNKVWHLILIWTKINVGYNIWFVKKNLKPNNNDNNEKKENKKI